MCEALGGAAAQGMMSDKYWLVFADVARAVTKKQAIESCMQRKGWSKTSAPGSHPTDIISNSTTMPLLPST
jgi:hypothetical protein